MNKRTFLCLLCLSGWSVSSCFPHQYHYVDDPMTWTEAQTYCREKYTDLATVENTEEMDQLMSSMPSDHKDHVWIGLYSKIQWKWSDGYNGTGSDYRNWLTIYPQPDFYLALEFCVSLSLYNKWADVPCQQPQMFICNNGTQQDPDFVIVENRKSWSNAQRYCRENYVDLATVTNDAENQMILSLNVTEDRVWIGLYRDPDISWSDGSGHLFQFWHGSPNPLGSRSVVCGTAYLPDSGKWNLKSCEDRFPFVCYDTGSKHVMKLRMKPDDPSVDLNGPAVKTGLLRELQEQLKESGLSGVTLNWREQPDRKVFHKERESSLEEDREKCELWN